ncbi:hypothetical protein [Aureliella helgolandensis]|uniref:hypothetical protein n=1 Tax=Aureliella helgolandensis TaxID=2527968 RepID=UPI0011A6D030|nr:hypothetical protein [Aureliella helgolandensis]
MSWLVGLLGIVLGIGLSGSQTVTYAQTASPTVPPLVRPVELPEEPPVQLILTGTEGQDAIVVANYFRGGVFVRSVTQHARLSPQGTLVPVELGFTGVRLLITIPTTNAVHAELLYGQQVVDRQSSQEKTVLRMQLGDVPEGQVEAPPRSSLNEAETTFVQAVFNASSQAQSRNIVSPLPIANIDWQTLDSYWLALKDHLGPLQRSSPAVSMLDGWIGWDGELGSRVLSGNVPFERGNCHFKLMILDDKLVDIEVESPLMPADWFTGPISSEAYVEKSELLLRMLFEGNVTAASLLFSRSYGDEITEAELATLCSTLRDDFGTEIASLDHQDCLFNGLDPASNSYGWSVRHFVQLASGKRCVSNVLFAFTCDADLIGRGELVSIDVRETWPSQAPTQTRLATQALQRILSVSPPEDSEPSAEQPESQQRAPNLQQLLNPDAAQLLDTSTLATQVEHCRQAFGSLTVAPDFALWEVKNLQNFTQASGTFSTSKGEIEGKLDFVNDELIGVSLFSRDYAMSTLNSLNAPTDLPELACEFWRALLRHETAAAYDRLAPTFQQQLTLEQFRGVVLQAGENAAPDTLDVQATTVRISDRLERGAPVMLTVYCVAQYPNEPPLPLACEFRLAGPNSPELLHFTSDLEISFPEDGALETQRLLTPFFDANTKGVEALLGSSDNSSIDSEVLTLFLQKLQSLIGEPGQLPATASWIHSYRDGIRTERLQGTIVPTQNSPTQNSSIENAAAENTHGANIPFSLSTHNGQLTAFDFYTAELAHFLTTEQALQRSQQRIQDFMSTWLDATDVTPSPQASMVWELRTTEVEQKLESMRDRIHNVAGGYIECVLEDAQDAEQDNTFQFRCTVSGVTGDIKLRIDIEFSAISCLVAGVELVE